MLYANGFEIQSKYEIKEIREFFELPFGIYKELKFDESYQKLNNNIPLEINPNNRKNIKMNYLKYYMIVLKKKISYIVKI